MNKFDILKLMHALTHKKFSKLNKTRSWNVESVTVNSVRKFIVEYDGEIVLTKEAKFRVLNQAVRICK